MKSPLEWEGRAAGHGGNAGEEAEAAVGRKESEKKKKITIKPKRSANSKPSVSNTQTYAATLLSYFHRRPRGAGALTTLSYIGTPCASTRTERTR